MRKANIWLAVFMFALGALCLYDALRLGIKWDPVSGPGPGYLPFYLALGTMIGTTIVIIKGLKLLKEGPGKPLIPEGGLKPILWVLIPSTAMVVIMELVGLHIAAGLFLGFYMRSVGKIGWATTLLVSILVPMSLYIAFDKLFLVPLPQGLWGGYLIPF